MSRFFCFARARGGQNVGQACSRNKKVPPCSFHSVSEIKCIVVAAAAAAALEVEIEQAWLWLEGLRL